MKSVCGGGVFRARLMASAAIGVAMAAASAGLAFAQGAQDQQGQQGQKDEKAREQIIVTGFRQSLATSTAVKRDNSSIVEAVSAEEIGKLPDISIAESLGRLPGVATQRLNGRSNVVSIRGLGPDFSTALLNGREQVTTSDNRGVEFDQYPAELLSQALVYKTPYAGLIGQGLAGTVDLRTIRPLERKGRVVSVSGRYEFNGGGSLNPDSPSNGYRATGIYVNQFDDDRWGLAIGIAAQRSPTQERDFNAWGYPTDSSGNLLIGGAKPFAGSDKLGRIGGFATLQFQPNDQFDSTLDLFYTDFNEDNTIRGIEFPLGWGGVPETTTSSQDGFATGGVFSDVHPVVRNDLNIRRAELFSSGWHGKYKGDVWGVDLDVSYSKATRRDQLIESYSGTSYNKTGVGDTITFTQAPGGVPTLTGTLDYTDPTLIVLTDPQGWGSGNDVVQAGFINAPRTVDELFHLRGSINRDLDTGLFNNIEIGADWGKRTKKRNIDQEFLTLPGSTTSVAGGATQSMPIPAEALLGTTTGLGFLGFGDQVTYDTRYLLDNVYVPVPVALSSFAVPQSWKVNENVFTAWVKAGIDSRVGDLPLTGNVGVEFVNTDQSSDGSSASEGGPSSGTIGAVLTPVHDGANYWDILPSLNLVLELSDSVKLRFGASRTLARARLDQLSASQSLGVNLSALGNGVTDPRDGATVFSITGGNSRLRPYIANQFDLSLEKYFGGAGYFAIAAYYKQLKDFVNTGDAVVHDFADIVSANLTPAQQAMLDTSLGFINHPTNNGYGRIRGMEGTLSLPLESIFRPLGGFGFITSASFTDSRVNLYPATDPTALTTITVPGLSKWVVNSTVYFQKNGFEARVSHRWRTEFLGEVAAISATRTFRTAQAESIIDAQIGYQFQSGALEGLRITVQGLNLTDEPFITYQGGDPRQIIDHQSFGRTYLIGASYSF